MHTKNNIPVLLKKTFLQVIEELSKNYSGSSLTDIFITVDKESGEVIFYDDEENRVGDVVIFDWIDKQNELSDKEIIPILREITIQLNEDNMFASLDIYKPFSVNYAQDNMEVIAELFTINDDDALEFINNDFMKKFDREFDDFLNKLLKD